ncbi:MAG: S-layer homology domain-containing protein [Firmicutes bacterium]|nr:S-layer homology domain-containing protein [Bacillota bacterium]
MMKKRMLSLLLCAVMLLGLLPVTEGSVSYAAGDKTIKGFLLPALEPVGTVLYMWGGGWNDATRIGVPQAMIDWYNSQDSSYDYHNYNDHSTANRAKGFDCSGFVGWSIYQGLHAKSNEGSGYTCVSRDVGKNYQARGWGTVISKEVLASNGYVLKAGDIGFHESHTFIVIGQCRDKSFVLVHSTPQAGVQIAGTPTPDGKYNSQAAALAATYMSRYPGTQKYEYLTRSGNYFSRCSFFRWNRSTLADPDGYTNMYADEILADLFASMNGTPAVPDDPIIPPDGVPFKDVSRDDWFADAVVFVYQNGFMGGTSETTFEAKAPMTRAMFATALYRISGSPAVTGGNPFVDVENGSWYQNAVCWAAENGITVGTSDTCFEPAAPVSREQMAVFLYRFATMDNHEPESGEFQEFADAAAVSDWAAGAMGWAVSEGIVRGKDEGLVPQATADRAQFAVMLQRYFQWAWNR